MEKTVREFKELCKSHSCRCTKQRLAVFSYIHENKKHPSVDQIWQDVKKQIPSITRESVFRILMELADWHVVYRMDKIVNARFDGFAGNHGHLICRKCGCIIDFQLPPELPEPEISEGFLADHIELRISGLCSACAKQAQKGKNRSSQKNTY